MLPGSLQNPTRSIRLGLIMRLISALLILSLVASGIEAATDIGGPLQSDDMSAHEVHGHLDGDDSGSPDREGKDARHFCHCAAHGAALMVAATLPEFAGGATVASIIETRPLFRALSPPRRPPKR